MPVGETGVVLDLGGQHELATGDGAFDHEGLQTGARCIDGGGEPGRAGSDDDHLFGHVFSSVSLAILFDQSNTPRIRNSPPTMA